jgi:hypothetical protein
MGAARRPGRLGVAGSRDDLLVTRALRDDAAIDKGVSSLKQLGLDDIGVNIDELSRCVPSSPLNPSLVPIFRSKASIKNQPTAA